MSFPAERHTRLWARVKSPRRDNCIVWAIGRCRKRGGYVSFRISLFSSVIVHAMWSQDRKNWYGYTSFSDKPRGWWWECLWFRGHVVGGDQALIDHRAKVVQAQRAVALARVTLAAATVAAAALAVATISVVPTAVTVATAAAGTTAVLVVEKSHRRAYVLFGILIAAIAILWVMR